MRQSGVNLEATIVTTNRYCAGNIGGVTSNIVDISSELRLKQRVFSAVVLLLLLLLLIIIKHVLIKVTLSCKHIAGAPHNH